MEGYVELLKKALAAETETVRLYAAILALAPQKHVTKLLEINADETDHQSIDRAECRSGKTGTGGEIDADILRYRNQPQPDKNG